MLTGEVEGGEGRNGERSVDEAVILTRYGAGKIKVRDCSLAGFSGRKVAWL